MTQLEQVAAELHGGDGRTAIRDPAALKVGQTYWVRTSEPEAFIRAGRFLGFEFVDDTTNPKEWKYEYREDLPEGWDEMYPDLIFENVRFPDHWALEAWEVTE